MKNNFTFTSSNILRIGIALVMVWFGSQQLLSPEAWTGFLPGWVSSLPISEILFVYLNGSFEIVFGILLLLNKFRKIASALLALHMIGIIFSLGYGAIAVRDFAIFIALVSIFMEKKIETNSAI